MCERTLVHLPGDTAQISAQNVRRRGCTEVFILQCVLEEYDCVCRTVVLMKLYKTMLEIMCQ